MSPPSRAAWIEIHTIIAYTHNATSPPSRAAWIEISDTLDVYRCVGVAAFTGGVD